MNEIPTVTEFDADFDEGCGDWTGDILRSLYESGIPVLISWDRDAGIIVKIGDMANRASESESRSQTVSLAILALRDMVLKEYPNSMFAEKNRPPYVSIHVPGSPAAVALGCSCQPDQTPADDGTYLCDRRCPEHGVSRYQR